MRAYTCVPVCMTIHLTRTLGSLMGRLVLCGAAMHTATARTISWEPACWSGPLKSSLPCTSLLHVWRIGLPSAPCVGKAIAATLALLPHRKCHAIHKSPCSLALLSGIDSASRVLWTILGKIKHLPTIGHNKWFSLATKIPRPRGSPGDQQLSTRKNPG